MPEALPHFRYHPDPVRTGVVEPSDATCRCCGRVRGFIYVGPVYSVNDLRDSLCPWCISDGSAAERLGATFADSNPLIQAGIPREIVDEVSLRTPSYVSWQEERWLTHCGDACEFHGDATVEDIANVSPETKRQVLSDFHLGEPEWKGMADGYTPGGDSAFYKFVCRRCGFVRLGWDCN